MLVRKNVKFIGITVFFACFCGIVYAAWSFWRDVDDTAYLSCLGSVGNQIQIRLAGDLFEPKGFALNLRPIDNNWRRWTQIEVGSVMSQIHGGDCSRFNNPEVDHWGRRINIAVRKGDDLVDIILWSNGPDGVSATKDDLVMPYGHKVPR